MTNIKDLLTQLAELQQQSHVLAHAMAVLNYDGETAAPPASARGRGETLSALAALHYDLFINDRVKDLLEQLTARSEELDAENRREVVLLLKAFRETTCIPKEEVAAWTQLRNDANAAWRGAKAQDDFSSFLPFMERVVETSVRFAGYRRPDLKPYDAMLDRYEEGITANYLDAYFADLRGALVPLVQAVAGARQPDTSFLQGVFPVEGQRRLSYMLMDLLAVDRERCSLGETEHPFTSGFSKWDTRITTHYHQEDLLSSLFSVIHEAGHGLYEMGIADAYQGRALGQAISMGIHESQSRLYENMLGRSLPFAQRLLPMLRQVFPGPFDRVDAQQLHRAINLSQPSLIRTEADELTYSLHIMVRYELEKALVQGSLKAKDLPGAWKDLYKEYLGVEVPNDALGVLQDVHWSFGYLGYFPSYSIGSAYAAQLFDALSQQVDVPAALAAGSTAPINDWLGEKVHRHGSLLRPEELLISATGAPFDVGHYTCYLRDKYSGLYQL